MKQPNPSEKMRILFDAHQCQLSEQEMAHMRQQLDSLVLQVEAFPLSDVRVLVEYNNRSNDYSVKISLILPGDTLVGNNHDPFVLAAFEGCLMGLEENIRAYKDRLGQVPERQKIEKGTHQDLEPTVQPDGDAIDRAVAGGDYTAFRTATLPYEESLRKRAGRWVERYPDVQARIGKGLEINDIVEEVFLTAFEEYEKRPRQQRLGGGLGRQIDPAIRTLQHRGEEELENINLARSAVEAEKGREAV